MRYSVLDDPVIEAEFLDGRRESLGIRRLLTEAHAVRDLIAISPIAKYAVLRTLVAFLMDLYRLDDGRPKALLAACQFDPAVLERYVSLCEKKGPCFDLLIQCPFMQRHDKDMDAGKEKPIAALFFDLPSGNNHVHFDHRFETEHSASPAKLSGIMRHLFILYGRSTRIPVLCEQHAAALHAGVGRNAVPDPGAEHAFKGGMRGYGVGTSLLAGRQDC